MTNYEKFQSQIINIIIKDIDICEELLKIKSHNPHAECPTKEFDDKVCISCGRSIVNWLLQDSDKIAQNDKSEAVHAYWDGVEGDGYAEDENGEMQIIYDVFECSNCGCEHRADGEPEWAYCPDCGAKMDLEESTLESEAVHAAPVVHGEWVDSGYGSYICSVCDIEWTLDDGIPRVRYCPNCGVKLKEPR